MKGFHDVMMGTEAVPAMAKTAKNAEELKSEQCNDVSYSHLIMSVMGRLSHVEECEDYITAIQ